MNFLEEHYRLLTAIASIAFVGGVIVMMFSRDWMRKWILNGNDKLLCPLEAKGSTPFSKEKHDQTCDRRWREHDKNSEERSKHIEKMAEKDRELLLTEIAHLKSGQDKMATTMDKIFDRLDRLQKKL